MVFASLIGVMAEAGSGTMQARNDAGERGIGVCRVTARTALPCGPVTVTFLLLRTRVGQRATPLSGFRLAVGLRIPGVELENAEVMMAADAPGAASDADAGTAGRCALRDALPRLGQALTCEREHGRNG
jgi:hypothetical protein